MVGYIFGHPLDLRTGAAIQRGPPHPATRRSCDTSCKSQSCLLSPYIFFVYFFSQKNIEEKNIYCGEILHTGKGVLDWPSHLPRGPINAGVERTRVGLCKAGVFLRPNRVLSFLPPAHSRSAQLFHATIKFLHNTSPPFLFLLRSSFHPPIRRVALQANRRRDLLRGWRMYGEGED